MRSSRLIGFSTGALAKGRFLDAIEILKGASIRAVEISALRLDELEPLLRDLPELDLSGFSYVSLHAPSNFSLTEEVEVVSLLTSSATQDLPIVVHPDTIHSWKIWRQLGSRLLVENMDKRKSLGRDVAGLKKVFERLPEARLCFDMAHARQIDLSMTEGYSILTAFTERLAEVHISDVGSRSSHARLSYMAAWDFSELTHLIPEEVPIIIESSVAAKDATREVSRVRQLFGRTNHVWNHANPLS